MEENAIEDVHHEGGESIARAQAYEGSAHSFGVRKCKWRLQDKALACVSFRQSPSLQKEQHNEE